MRWGRNGGYGAEILGLVEESAEDGDGVSSPVSPPMSPRYSSTPSPIVGGSLQVPALPAPPEGSPEGPAHAPR